MEPARMTPIGGQKSSAEAPVSKASLGQPKALEEISFHGIIGTSDRMKEVFTLIAQVAGTDATVLITGESGTGKELVAKAIHECSDRSEGPFIAINCSALPESIIESELFGHEKGAFTGRHSREAGPIRSGKERNTLPRRDRGSFPDGPGEASQNPTRT